MQVGTTLYLCDQRPADSRAAKWRTNLSTNGVYCFLPRRYASAVYAVVMCPFVCPYVCHTPVFKTAKLKITQTTGTLDF